MHCVFSLLKLESVGLNLGYLFLQVLQTTVFFMSFTDKSRTVLISFFRLFIYIYFVLFTRRSDQLFYLISSLLNKSFVNICLLTGESGTFDHDSLVDLFLTPSPVLWFVSSCLCFCFNLPCGEVGRQGDGFSFRPGSKLPVQQPSLSFLVNRTQVCVGHLTGDVSENGSFLQGHKCLFILSYSSSKAILLILIVFASDQSKTGM